MRISLRTSVQVITLFTVVLFLNGYIVLFYDQKRNSDAKDPGVAASFPVHGLKAREVDQNGTKTVRNTATSHLDRPSERTNSPLAGESFKPQRNGAEPSEVASGYKSARLSNSGKSPKTAGRQENRAPKDSIFNSDIDYSLDFSESRPTELGDIFISVKTTKRYHKERLGLLLSTWTRLAKDETYFFTDGDDAELVNKTRGHVINTNCSAVHSRVALCCKMSVEYDYFIASRKRWFCHVDDDTYINIPELSRLLKKFNHTEDWYLGKPSLNHPLEITDPERRGQKVAFWFATGGAGVCISRSLALKMMPYTAGGRLKNVCAKIRLPDDCTIGFIIYNYLKKELTVIPKFHSHLEGLWLLKPEDMDQQITLSYDWPTLENRKNIVHIDGFSEQDDPTRFRSIHCWLFPYLEGCPQALHS